MVKTRAAILLMLLSAAAGAQEALLPLQSTPSRPLPSKNTATAIPLPFFDDFSPTGPYPAPDRWQHGGASLTDGNGIFPPTIGAATLDALDIYGSLYPAASTSIFPADTLASQRIRLDGMQPSDSVVLSFYYLPGGGSGNMWERIGMAPDAQDSLFLDFYHPADSTWHTVWCRGGISVDSLLTQTGRDWQYTSIAISDPAYLDSSFMFRFRNYCSLTPTTKPGLNGNCDYWYLDYIYLDRNRSTATTPAFRDIAFVSPASSLLKNYNAMPARQYRSSDMADNTSMTITNLYSSELASHYSYSILDSQGQTLHSYDGGYENAPPFLPSASYQTAPPHALPDINWAFPETTSHSTYSIVHTIKEGNAADLHPCNDTVTFQQVFADYFAYDDGSAENGYGITSTASTLYLAYRFDLNIEDTLTALDLYFNRTADRLNEQVPFYISVWQAENNRPGTLLYRDSERRYPAFLGLNRYHRYILEQPLLVEGSIFVGFEQESNTHINLGFDRNRNTSDRIFFLTGTNWEPSILSGSLMMRPCLGLSATLGAGIIESTPPLVHPNPASDVLHIDNIAKNSWVELYDNMGRQCLSKRHNGPLTLAHLPAGLYLLRIIPPAGTPPSTLKIIITR